MLTINDHEFIRDTFGAFHCKPVKTRYVVGGASRSQNVMELLYTNFET